MGEAKFDALGLRALTIGLVSQYLIRDREKRRVSRHL